MSNKKSSPRSMPIITRESYKDDSLNNSSILNEFVNALQKTSVQPIHYEQSSIYDQISSIMGRKSKYPTVAAAVEDMKERSGLTAYLNTHSKENKNDTKKVAQEAEIEIFVKCPQIKSTLNNYLEATKGNLDLPPILEKIKSIHKKDVNDDSLWDDPKLLNFINNENIKIKKKYPNDDNNNTDLGKIPNFKDDESNNYNNDIFKSLTPAVVTSADYEALIMSYFKK